MLFLAPSKMLRRSLILSVIITSCFCDTGTTDIKIQDAKNNSISNHTQPDPSDSVKQKEDKSDVKSVENKPSSSKPNYDIIKVLNNVIGSQNQENLKENEKQGDLSVAKVETKVFVNGSQNSDVKRDSLGGPELKNNSMKSQLQPTDGTKNSTQPMTLSSSPLPSVVINDTSNLTTSTATPNEPILPEKGSAEAEHNSSMAIFFVLCVLALGILLIHLMLLTNFQYLPESVVIIFLGALIGFIINFFSDQNIGNWRKEEAFSPTAFFLVLLPPIIFESGYNLHKGNFFQNIGSILVFAIVGTTISALVIGTGIYILGLADVAYHLSFIESFAFGSLISAVDPVATVAIFHALDIDPVLNMLVFGESILNDAIAIVLTTSVLESNKPDMSPIEAVFSAFNRFCLMFFASAGIGVIFALISALLLKHVDLRKNPSLEFGMMLVFTYAPYALAEGIHLSGKKTL